MTETFIFSGYESIMKSLVHLYHWSFLLHLNNQSLRESQPRDFKELSWRCRQEYWYGSQDSRPIIKLWVKSSFTSLVAPKNPITQKPWLWTPLPHQKMTQPPVLAPVRQRFCNRSHFSSPHISPSVFKQHCRATFPNSVGLKATLAIWQPEETVSATIDIFPILLACHLPFSGHLIDSDSLYWVFHMKENFVIKC